MIIEATIDHWTINVADLRAIPRDHLSGLPLGRVDGICSLEVIGVPAAGDSDRDYFFRVARMTH